MDIRTLHYIFGAVIIIYSLYMARFVLRRKVDNAYVPQGFSYEPIHISVGNLIMIILWSFIPVVNLLYLVAIHSYYIFEITETHCVIINKTSIIYKVSKVIGKRLKILSVFKNFLEKLWKYKIF